jgi:hypothetical protein
MKYSTSTLGVLALSALCTAAFVACSSPDPSTTTSTGSGGGSTSTSDSTATSGSTTASTGTGSGLTGEAQVAKLCDDVVGPMCTALFACCTDPVKLASAGTTVEGCKAKLAMECTADITGGILAQAKAGNTVLDEAKLAACVTKLGSMAAGGAACVMPPWFVLQLDCATSFQGTLAPGAACDSSMLPDQDYIPCKDGVCENGKCKAFIASGAACDPTQNNTAAAGCNYANGELCIGTGTVGKCGPQGKVGDPCPDPGQDKSFSCESLSCGPAGTCVAPTAVGICAQG